MDAVLVDTNVMSYMMKVGGDTRVQLYERHVRDKTIAISFVTVGELYEWSTKPGREWGARRLAVLAERLRTTVIIPYDDGLCRAYAALGHLKTQQGSPRIIPANDRWIAATAIRHSVPLVSHNRRDFEGIPGLVLISEAPPILPGIAGP